VILERALAALEDEHPDLGRLGRLGRRPARDDIISDAPVDGSAELAHGS
jgi:hypothetical protein